MVGDLFNDADTRALCERTVLLPGNLRQGIDGSRIVESLIELLANEQPVALVYGSGFERDPGIIETLSRAFPLAGNSCETVRSVKEPLHLAQLCDELGISHPETRVEAPDDCRGWLAKLSGGAGGSHVRPVEDRVVGGNDYFQRFVAGQNLSALFLAQAGKAHIVGFSRQWPMPGPGAPFRYGGAVRLARIEPGKRQTIQAWLDALTARAGLVGLCSADLVDGPNGLHLIEINPRAGATLDIFDSDEHPLLIEHLRVIDGHPPSIPRYRGAVASAIAYANHAIDRFPAIDWPPLTADHQMPGTTLRVDDPVCTALARARSAAAAERAVKARVLELASFWREDFP